MRILVTGGNGQVGFELIRALAPIGSVIPVDRSSCDLSNPDEIRSVLRANRPDVVINAAAYTAVDAAEDDEATAIEVNANAPRLIAEEVKMLGSMLVHYSTDYVFDGRKAEAYSEEDQTNPMSVYGRSKLAGEAAILETGADALILRTSWVVGAHGNNFAKTMLRLASDRESLRVVSDQHGTPTPASLIADSTAHLVRQFATEGRDRFPFGRYHIASSGTTTWFEYARFVIAEAITLGLSLKMTADDVVPISTSDYPTAATRPGNSVLNTAKIRATFGLAMPDWRAGVQHFLRQIINSRNNTNA